MLHCNDFEDDCNILRVCVCVCVFVFVFVCVCVCVAHMRAHDSSALASMGSPAATAEAARTAAVM
jgi:hypothetical protein